jgi:hypothetical protein
MGKRKRNDYLMLSAVPGATFGYFLDLQDTIESNVLRAPELRSLIEDGTKTLQKMKAFDWIKEIPTLPIEMTWRMKALGIEQEQAKCYVLENRREQLDTTDKMARDEILRLYQALGRSSLEWDIVSLVLQNLMPPELKMLREVCRSSYMVGELATLLPLK